jgi:anaerobic ribonucleoside-triphosphate reductase
MKPLGGPSSAPKKLSSFCGSFVNLVFALSSQVAGAVGTPEFLMYFNYFAEKEFGSNYLEEHKYEIDQYLQQVVYSMNQPSGQRGFQSVFWNVSVFDKYYFESIFESFSFPDESFTRPNWTTLDKLQNYFIDWLRLEREKELLTFPVTTVAMLTENGEPKDQEFARLRAADLALGARFFVYMSDSADSLASCCFRGDQYVDFVDEDGDLLTQRFDKLKVGEIYNLPYNNELLKGKVIKINGKGRRMLEIISDSSPNLRLTEDHICVTDRGDILAKDLSVGDELITSDFLIDSEILAIQEIPEEEEFVYCFEMLDQSKPYFELTGGVITHNCRLRNEVSDNTFSHTLGAGGVATGSINVITMNLNRIIQNGQDLAEQVRKIHKYQVAYKSLIQDYQKAGLLPIYDIGFVTLDKQFLTIGVNGLVEAAESRGIRPENNVEYKKFCADILKTISEENKKAKEKYGHMFNTEFVPAENLGVKNANWDKKDGYIVTRDAYNSYFYPVESESVNVLDKFILHGAELNQYLDGGSALHLNLQEHLDVEGYYNLFKIAAKTGCNYFCTNVLTTICNSCYTIDVRTLESCPKCGSSDLDFATRIIGFLRRISSFSSPRQVESGERFYHGD